MIYLRVGLAFAEGAPLSVRWPPLLPLILAALSHVTDDVGLAAQLLSLIVSAAMVPLLMSIAASLAGRLAGVLAGLLAAFDGYLVRSAADVMTEPLYTFWLLAFLALLAGARFDELPRGRLLLAGACLGIACLARPTGLGAAAVALGMLGLPALARRAPPARIFLALALLALPVAACVLPWTIRNLRATGHVILTTTGSGSTLLGSNCRPAHERREAWLPAPECGVFSTQELQALETMNATDPVSADAMMLRAGIEEIGRNRDLWGSMLARKLGAFWGWGHLGLGGSALSRASLLALTALLPFAVMGAARLFRAGWRQVPDSAAVSLAWIAYAQGLALVFWGGHRMRAPIEPLVLAFAAIGLTWAWRRLRALRPFREDGLVQ